MARYVYAVYEISGVREFGLDVLIALCDSKRIGVDIIRSERKSRKDPSARFRMTRFSMNEAPAKEIEVQI